MNITIVLMSMGFVFVLVGMLLIMLSMVPSREEVHAKRFEYGGGVMIGPFPIVFGSSNRMVLAASIILAVLMVISIVLMIFSMHVLR